MSVASTWGWIASGGLLGASLAALGVGIFSPQSRLMAPVVSRGPRNGPPRVALTFDDGPDAVTTPLVLEVLERHGVSAAFFVIGANARRSPETLRLIHQRGHLICNHGLDHSHWGMWRLRSYWEEQIRQTDLLVREATGSDPRYFRPLLGMKQPLMGWAARRLGRTIVTWSRRGYDGIESAPETILARLLPGAGPGDILLLHDGSPPQWPRSREATVLALPRLIEGLRARGLEIVRLDELLEGPAQPSN